MNEMTGLDPICSRRELSTYSKASAAFTENRVSEDATAPMTATDCHVRFNGQCGDQLVNRVRRVPTQREAARRIEVSLSYMLEHLDKPLRVSTLSALAGVSASYFFSLFKCATGYSPNDYFIRLRVRYACELLQETDLRVKEVAAVLGYGDQFYFSRVFKSVNGVAPSYYRSRN